MMIKLRRLMSLFPPKIDLIFVVNFDKISMPKIITKDKLRLGFFVVLQRIILQIEFNKCGNFVPVSFHCVCVSIILITYFLIYWFFVVLLLFVTTIYISLSLFLKRFQIVFATSNETSNQLTQQHTRNDCDFSNIFCVVFCRIVLLIYYIQKLRRPFLLIDSRFYIFKCAKQLYHMHHLLSLV